ncbi:hypothetical protein [Hyphomicrobium sp. 2TAF46]|uniref:hypothetical protein n=1 Tax=Hyphomicrobium sp. 2TAF46 TaxID=3233019 RepID=UPI003F8D971C
MRTALRIAMALLLPVMLSHAAASGDSIFDVEHARAEYRAGSLTPNGADLMDRWGWPSGCYPPQPCYVRPPPPRPLYHRRPDWRARR